MNSLFISHGAPTLAIEDNSSANFLRNLSTKIPAPKAIIVISAHWETDLPEITGSAQPETIHDFYGFPKQLYDLQYNVAGDLELANKIAKLLGKQAKINNQRGLDHGAWNPLMLIYPDANIPVVQLSVQPQKNAEWHYQIGRSLSPLKNDDVLIIGSGSLTHNLYEALRGNHKEVPNWVSEFANWVADKVAQNDVASLLNWEILAPYAQKNHPTPEHFLPFFVALGAANSPLNAKRIHTDTTFGVLAMDAYEFT